MKIHPPASSESIRVDERLSHDPRSRDICWVVKLRGGNNRTENSSSAMIFGARFLSDPRDDKNVYCDTDARSLPITRLMKSEKCEGRGFYCFNFVSLQLSFLLQIPCIEAFQKNFL